ncbi:hypothetical protein K501DRAFT_298739 [Backusella circina FSU 941]|nr:hypothetical protein K501DRAFT_298739 [Backusella circina FSU 941]
MCTTEEEYEIIILSVNAKDVEITKSAKNLTQAIKNVKAYASKNLHNVLYANEYNLGLTESPKNPLNNTILESSAAVQTSTIVANQLFLDVNAIWDGVLFKTGDHKVSLGFVEFSGGVNDATTPEKERHDVKKIYSMMIDVMNGYPANNTMFFEELVVHEEVMFRIQHTAIIVPRTTRQLVKFTSEIPKLIVWKDAVVKQIEQF